MEEGGVGFDYRLQMAIADKWIEVSLVFIYQQQSALAHAGHSACTTPTALLWQTSQCCTSCDAGLGSFQNPK